MALVPHRSLDPTGALQTKGVVTGIDLPGHSETTAWNRQPAWQWEKLKNGGDLSASRAEDI
jgi:hypothetical protein